MAVTNEFERDLVNQAHLKRPGRVDMIVFQNLADVGDGSPGIQRCFRNYLHEGGMEKDLDLIAHGIKGSSVDINNAELQQLSNIGASVITASIWTEISHIEAVTITNAQWVFVGEADQPVKQADSPTFGGLALTGNLTLAANSITGTSVNINNAELQQLSLIGGATILGTQWAFLGNMDQDVITTSSPTFVGLTLSADLVTTSTVDGVDVSTHVHSGAGQGGTVDHANLDNKGSNTHTQIDTHIASSATPHVSSAEKTSWGTAVTHITANGSSHGYIDQSVINGASPSFTIVNSKLNGGIDKTGGGVLVINNKADVGITFMTFDAARWLIEAGGNLRPASASAYDVGDQFQEVQYFFSCNAIQDTTCADFSDKTIEELYSMFAQIKPMVDGTLHYEKVIDKYYPHVDFETLPLEFQHPASRDGVKNNAHYEKISISEYQVKETQILQGETVAINTGPYLYALKDLVVKCYDKIKELELELEVLKGI